MNLKRSLTAVGWAIALVGIQVLFDSVAAQTSTPTTEPTARPIPAPNWYRETPDGRPYNEIFSHISDDRLDNGAIERSGEYCIRGDQATHRLTRIVMDREHIGEGQGCRYNYNPVGDYSANVEILPGGVCFKWRRRWDGAPCREIYTAYFERFEVR